MAASAAPFVAPSHAAEMAPGTAGTVLAQQWRAVSRIGYGPNALLLAELHAAKHPQDWAVEQIDRAYAASQTLPALPPDVQAINAPLPELFAHWKREREARAAANAANTAATMAPASAPAMAEPVAAPHPVAAPAAFDFSTDAGPLEFKRLQVQKAIAWHLRACSQPAEENPLLARMTEFWFNHFNVSSGKGEVGVFVGHYLINVARKHALGRFEDLLLASARHPAMLYYLDQHQSVGPGSADAKGGQRGLNENYARELMELHTLGVDGGYTQDDVRALAMILTGWTVGPEAPDGFRFAARSHEGGAKVLLGQSFSTLAPASGESEGLDALRMLARHPSTARRVCTRLAQFFVADRPAPALVERLRQTFLASEGDMRAVLRVLLQSGDFWDPSNRLFKTPLDFACSALTATGAVTDMRNLQLSNGFLSGAGQPLHGWQTPDGYATDAATWMVPEAFTRRADYAIRLVQQSGDTSRLPDLLAPFLSSATQAAVLRARVPVRNGLLLASPEFMRK